MSLQFKEIMNSTIIPKLPLLVILSIWISLPFLVFAQEREIKGKIFDSAEGASLPNINIKIKGSNNGTQTDDNGNFSLKIPGSSTTLTVSSAEYISQDIDIINTNYIEVRLVARLSSLNNIILIGYGTARRKDLTGAVDRVTSEEFNKGIITNPMAQLQGKVAGLVIVQPGGDPNGEFTVRLRGATSLEGQPPLLVIDGIAIDDFNKALTTINPADIQSFDILKDAAAAAIYGSRGANGVILVTTKKGKTGKISTEYNGFAGIEQQSHTIRVLNAGEWRKATEDINTGSLDAGGNVNWQKAIAQTGFSQSHLIGISGGTDQLNFHGSAGYIKQQGIILNSGKEVVTGRLTAVQKTLKNRLQVQYNVNASSIKRDLLPDQTSASQSRTGGSQVFEGVLQYLPVIPEYNSDGSYYQPASASINPLFFLKDIYSKRRETFFQGSLKTDYEIFKGLKSGGLVAFSKGADVYDFFFPRLPGSNTLAAASKFNYNKQNFSGDIHGSYHKTFNKHNIDITGVYEYNKYINDDFGLTARGFLAPELLNNNLGAGTTITTSDIFSHKNEIKLISFLGRLVYNFDDQYLVTFNFRRDGSSKFGPDNRWGNFPSIAIAWRANNAHLFKNISWLNNLKFRLSYGLTGNQENLPPNSYQVLYNVAGPYLYNGQFYQSYAVSQENNPDLKWEVRKSLNIGIDFSVLNNRLNGSVDVFNDKTNDMLFQYDLPQPPFLTGAVTANAANATNKGIEANIESVLIKNKKFQWSVHTVIATLKNKITNLSGRFRGTILTITNRHYGYAEGSGLSGAYISQLQTGYPAGVFWLPQHVGLDANGQELFNNYDDNGKLIGTSNNYTDQDRVFIDPTPDFTWGVNNNFSWKNFDLNFLIRGVQGQKVFANSLLNLGASVYLPAKNVTPDALTNGFIQQPVPSTYWVRNASFARLENITLGYNFKPMKGINTFRIYLTAINLFVITNYRGIDPEIKTEGTQRYIDKNYYPKTRGIVLGLNLEI
jgi:TonB-dependent starch-binding outer membrane protein SusC